jgi:PmbA protein
LNTGEIAERLLDLIGRSGVDLGEVYVTKSEGLEISLRDQSIERLRNKQEGGYGLRLIRDGRMAFVHSSDFREDSLRRVVEEGAELARAVEADDSNVLPDPSEKEVAVDTFDPSFDEISFDRKVELLKDVETFAFAYDPSISMTEYIGYEDSKSETVIANTRGLFRQGKSTAFSFGASVVARQDEDVESGGDDSRSHQFEGLDLPSQVASRACRKAVSLLGGTTPPTGACPVIFDRDAGYALMAHFLAMVRGDNVVQGLSALRDRMGERIGSDIVSVVDDGTLEGGVAARAFDAEGVSSQRTVVIDRGVLRSFLFDTRSARKAGARTTANANRNGFRAQPNVGPTNFFMVNGTETPESIVKSTGTGLIAISLAGWWMGVNPATGDFSSGAKGLWVENGEVVHPVRNVTIASNVLDMLAGIDAVGDDLAFRDRMITPTFRVAEMKMGGS